MTQVAPQPTPTPAVAAAPAAAAPATPGAPSYRENVPALLNRWQLIAVAACVLFGVLAALLQFLSWQANGRAADNTEQLVRVQQIQSSLLRADALATNAFLNGGLEPAEQRAEYDAAIDQVLRGIADAAEAQPADREALAELNTQLSAYTSYVSQARVNNRQGLPVGAEYLNLAGTSLRAEALPIVAALVDANSERAVDEMGGQHPFLLFLVGVAAVAVLWWVNEQLARRFRRRFNVGVAAAGVAVTVLTFVTAYYASGRANDNDELRDGGYRLAVDEASARTAANDAKANESIRLIKRGSLIEEPWVAAATRVEDTASVETLRLWETYVVRHEEIIALDESGAWDDAVTAATTPGADGSTAALNAFDEASQQVIIDAGEETTASLRSGGVLALLLTVLTLLGGLAAAGAATWGVNQRRREYS